MTTRRSSPAGFVFAWLLVAGLCIAFWRWALLIGLPIVVGLVVLGAAVRTRHPGTGHREPVRQLAESAVYRARCDECGARRSHGAESCRYCGRSLVVTRSVTP